MATLEMMREMKQLERLSPVARRAWKRLALEFPLWIAHLDTRDGELEFAIPAPSVSTAGYLVAFSHENQLWVRFSPPHLCYPADDEDEMVSVIKQLTADNVVFRLVMKGDEWVETTLTKPKKKTESKPGHTVRLISWSGRYDREMS
jgi:hypothetical protein